MLELTIAIRGVTKKYPGVGAVLENFDLSIHERDFFVLYGPSASGKTTLLNLVAGLEKPDSGEIQRRCKDGQPTVGYLFQNYEQTLFPWLTNASNIAMPLKMNRYHKKSGTGHIKVEDTLKRLGFEIPLTMHPFEMSGGGKQKVALARAFVAEPDILLLDEPFNSLDISDREMMRSEIVRLWEETGVTVVFVTHDLDEALLVGNQLAIIGDKPARLMNPPIPIRLPYPRTPHLLASSELLELRQRALRLFEDGKHKLDKKVHKNA